MIKNPKECIDGCTVTEIVLKTVKHRAKITMRIIKPWILLERVNTVGTIRNKVEY